MLFKELSPQAIKESVLSSCHGNTLLLLLWTVSSRLSKQSNEIQTFLIKFMNDLDFIIWDHQENISYLLKPKKTKPSKIIMLLFLLWRKSTVLRQILYCLCFFMRQKSIKFWGEAKNILLYGFCLLFVVDWLYF